MKKIIAINIFFLCTTQAFAQSMERSVVASAGGNSITGNQAEWTVGETVTFTATAGNNTLSQGFHQNTALSLGLDQKTLQAVLNVYPNPVTNKLWFELKQYQAQACEISILDVTGKLLQQNTFPPMLQISGSFDMQAYANGSYFIAIYQDGVQLKSVKITKMN